MRPVLLILVFLAISSLAVFSRAGVGPMDLGFVQPEKLENWSDKDVGEYLKIIANFLVQREKNQKLSLIAENSDSDISDLFAGLVLSHAFAASAPTNMCINGANFIENAPCNKTGNLGCGSGGIKCPKIFDDAQSCQTAPNGRTLACAAALAKDLTGRAEYVRSINGLQDLIELQRKIGNYCTNAQAHNLIRTGRVEIQSMGLSGAVDDCKVMQGALGALRAAVNAQNTAEKNKKEREDQNRSLEEKNVCSLPGGEVLYEPTPKSFEIGKLETQADGSKIYRKTRDAIVNGDDENKVSYILSNENRLEITIPWQNTDEQCEFEEIPDNRQESQKLCDNKDIVCTGVDTPTLTTCSDSQNSHLKEITILNKDDTVVVDGHQYPLRNGRRILPGRAENRSNLDFSKYPNLLQVNKLKVFEKGKPYQTASYQRSFNSSRLKQKFLDFNCVSPNSVITVEAPEKYLANHFGTGAESISYFACGTVDGNKISQIQKGNPNYLGLHIKNNVVIAVEMGLTNDRELNRDSLKIYGQSTETPFIELKLRDKKSNGSPRWLAYEGKQLDCALVADSIREPHPRPFNYVKKVNDGEYLICDKPAKDNKPSSDAVWEPYGRIYTTKSTPQGTPATASFVPIQGQNSSKIGYWGTSTQAAIVSNLTTVPPGSSTICNFHPELKGGFSVTDKPINDPRKIPGKSN